MIKLINFIKSNTIPRIFFFLEKICTISAFGLCSEIIYSDNMCLLSFGNTHTHIPLCNQEFCRVAEEKTMFCKELLDS